MNKLSVFICLLVSFVVNAQYTGPGFYRVHNVLTDRYICIKGTHYERTPRPDAFWPCIKMLPDSTGAHISDAGSLIYIPRLNQTSLYAQGVSTYSLTGLLMEVSLSSAMHEDMVTYLAFTQYQNFPCNFRDFGVGLAAGADDITETRWWIEPVNEESLDWSYFGVTADEDANGMYWTSLCCDFPFLIPDGGGVQGAYRVDEIVMGDDGQYCAVAVKAYGQGEVVPAATPVLLKCEAAEASANKLIPTGDIANNTELPIADGLLRGNYFSNFYNHCSYSDYSVMAEYIPDQVTPASATSLALGIDANGRMGFFPKAEGTYMDANTAWLGIEDLGLEGVTAVYLVEAVAEPQIQPGDANGDGEIDVKDVSVLIDYLLGAAMGDTVNVYADSAINLTGADVNEDGEVTIKDVSLLIDRILNGTAL